MPSREVGARVRRKLARLQRMPAMERLLTAESVVLLAGVRLGLRTFGFNPVLRTMAGSSTRPGPPPPDDGGAAADVIARSVERAARHSPGHATCLSRSLVVWWLLRSRSQPADLRIGVRRPGADLEAHAWVETNGRVLTDQNDVHERFAAFQRPIS
jgi:hypothetical protein